MAIATVDLNPTPTPLRRPTIGLTDKGAAVLTVCRLADQLKNLSAADRRDVVNLAALELGRVMTI